MKVITNKISIAKHLNDFISDRLFYDKMYYLYYIPLIKLYEKMVQDVIGEINEGVN